MTQVKSTDGKPAGMAIVQVSELYSHVQTAEKLGYETLLEAVDGRLQVVFVKKPKVNIPQEFWVI